MRAHQIMKRHVTTVGPETSIADAASIMLREHISGLPVINSEGELVGIISEGDFVRRCEINTQKKHNRWLRLLEDPGQSALNFAHERGRKVWEIMTPSPITICEDGTLEEVVNLMERHHIKRLPVMKGKQLVGIVARSNLLQAVASLSRDVPDPTASDDRIRDRIVQLISKKGWAPINLGVFVRDGVVDVSGTIVDERSRTAIIVAAENVPGVSIVHDNLHCILDEGPEDE